MAEPKRCIDVELWRVGAAGPGDGETPTDGAFPRFSETGESLRIQLTDESDGAASAVTTPPASPRRSDAPSASPGFGGRGGASPIDVSKLWWSVLARLLRFDLGMDGLSEAAIAAAFGKLDADGDGALGASELAAAVGGDEALAARVLEGVARPAGATLDDALAVLGLDAFSPHRASVSGSPEGRLSPEASRGGDGLPPAPALDLDRRGAGRGPGHRGLRRLPPRPGRRPPRGHARGDGGPVKGLRPPVEAEPPARARAARGLRAVLVERRERLARVGHVEPRGRVERRHRPFSTRFG